MSTPTRGRACAGKQQHRTEDGARAQLARLVRLRGALASAYATYQCRHCTFWHIGHKPKRSSR